MKRKMVSVILTIVMVVSMLPIGALSVGAADTSNNSPKSVELGLGPIAGYDEVDGYQYIYYGVHNTEPIQWRVLDDKTNTGTDGLLLLTEGLYGTGTTGDVSFDTDKPGKREYQGSDAQKWCNTFFADSFTAAEQSRILATTKSDGVFTSSTQSVSFEESENILNGDRIFFLSAEEVERAEYGFVDDAARIAYYGTSKTGWWLRSPKMFVTNNVGFVIASSGYVYQRTVWSGGLKARPAFNLNTGDVAFVEAATSSQASTGLAAVSDYAGNEWKLNLLDSSRNFAVSERALNVLSGGTATINYTGAKAGTNEYISAILVNADGDILYSGELSAANENGAVNFTIPADLSEGNYTLRVFNEQANGDKKTDYVSTFSDVALTVEAGHLCNGVLFDEWDSADALPSTAGNYCLTKDVELKKAWAPPSGTVLCLNGHNIIQTGNEKATIFIYASSSAEKKELTVYDCQDKGSITHATGTKGTGVDVTNGIFRMHGGSISGNTTSYAGGIYVGENSEVILSGNTKITNNTATEYGGGIYVPVVDKDASKSGSVILSDNVEVSGNRSGKNGQGGGILFNGKSLVISDNVIASDNYQGEGQTTSNNLYLGKGRKITIGSSGLGTKARIAVMPEVRPYDTAPITIVEATNADYSASFVSDHTKWIVVNSGTGAAQTVQLKYFHTHSWSNEWSGNGMEHWHKCTVEGCPITNEFDMSGYGWHESTGDNVATYTKKAKCDTCGREYGDIVPDEKKPTGIITIEKNTWNTFQNNVDFELFLKEKQTITITGNDAESGVSEIAYYLAPAEMTIEELETLESSAWTVYNEAFDIDAENKYVIYVRVSDKANNTIYINSAGIVLDKTAPVIAGLENGKDVYGDATFTVDEDNLASVTVDGNNVDVVDGKYTITADNKEHTIVVTDKAGNKTECTLTVYVKRITSPQTGDTGNTFLWFAVLFVSGIGVMGASVYKKKKIPKF